MTLSDDTIASVQAAQATMSALTMLGLTNYKFPPNVELNDGDIFDFVCVGSGAGGGTIASRLTEDGKTTVALIEAGGIPPLESVFAGLFPLLVNSIYDWNITSFNDCQANQNLQNNIVEVTQGKMLGGSSSLHHAFRNIPNTFDMDRFAAAACDKSYNLENMLKYFKNSENLQDEEILAKYPQYHGSKGPLVVTRDPSVKNINILSAFKEAGNAIILDANPETNLGYHEPLYLIGEVWRQSAAECYLGRAKNRPNLFVQIKALATKIIINSSNVATGVRIRTSDGTYKTINARKEVIVSCGTIKSPQLLMLSGIGIKSHLEKFNIKVKADLPVGDNLIDHASALIGFKLQKSNESVVLNPSKFPAPVAIGFVSLDGTKEPTYQSINSFIAANYEGLLQICVWVFKYKNKICAELFKANVGREMLFSVVNLLHPKSRGKVRLNSTDPAINPTVKLGYLSNLIDLNVFGKSLQDFASVVNTSYFKSIKSEIIKFDLPACEKYVPFSFEYWKCYGKCMTATGWHYIGTCAIRKVVDNQMRVKGIKNLRVVDASIMPSQISGKIIATVFALAEKAAELIKRRWGLC